jgi:hypothetical protein
VHNSITLLVSALFALAACGGGNGSTLDQPDAGGGGGTGSDGGGGEPRPGEVAPPDAIVAPPVTPPASLPPAPPIAGDIRYVPGRDSALVYLPVVAGVRDYRVYALGAGVTVHDVGGGTQIDGATLFCAGLRQHNQCDTSEAYDFGGQFRIAPCSADVRAVHVPKEVLRVVQIDGLRAASDVVVEAIDDLCPFPGAEGNQHVDLPCEFDGAPPAPAVVGGKVVTWRHCPATFPVRTAAEITAQYGSLIVNGHGPAAPAPGDSPTSSIGLPAAARAPVVLGRAVVHLTPTGTATKPAGFDFWEDFADDGDQPQLVVADGDGTLVPKGYPVWMMKMFQTRTLDIYNHSSDTSQPHVARGTLRSLLADAGQDVMASNLMIPRQPFALPASDAGYVHVTFAAPTDATLRRYWIFVACGADAPGKTIGSGPGFPIAGGLAGGAGIVFAPGFMDPDGTPISTAGWNCLELVPRNGTYDALPGGPFPRPETDVRAVVGDALASYDAVNEHSTRHQIAIVSPDLQWGNDPAAQGTWPRTWNAQHQPTGVMLDDEMYIEQRTRLDVFFNRGRVVLFANRKQKLCSDFPSHRLTMAEAAIGIGQVMYHTSAEKGDLDRDDWLQTAQYQYRKNLPFIDQRGFDDFGVQTNVALPAGFDEALCYGAK